MKKTHGVYYQSPKGYQFYLPNPLPPMLEWDSPVMNALSAADMLLGKLAGEGGRLPNPHIFTHPLIVREAVLSSQIEGTQASLGDVFVAQAGAGDEARSVDVKEVENYITALSYGIERLKTLPLSLRLIREIHEKLMTHVRGAHATPGAFRISQNWIGVAGCTLTTASYVPPAPDHLMACLGDLETFFYNKTLPPLIQIGLIHYQFEAIHPFLDGNGRVGRLLIILFLIERAILPSPLLYLSAFFEATRQEYYDRLSAVTRDGAWNEWLQYFLNGVARQSEDVLSRLNRMNQLLSAWRVAVGDPLTSTPNQIIDQLTANPFITITGAAQALNISYTTAQRALIKLEGLCVVYEVSGGRRNRLYCAKNLLSILEEPTVIKRSF